MIFWSSDLETMAGWKFPWLLFVYSLLSHTTFLYLRSFLSLLWHHSLCVTEELFSHYSTTLLSCTWGVFSHYSGTIPCVKLRSFSLFTQPHFLSEAEEIFSLCPYSHIGGTGSISIQIHPGVIEDVHTIQGDLLWLCPFHSSFGDFSVIWSSSLLENFWDLKLFCLQFDVFILTWPETDEDAGADQQLERTRPPSSMASWELMQQKTLPYFDHNQSLWILALILW